MMLDTAHDARPRAARAPDLTLSDLSERLALTTARDTCKGLLFCGVLSASETLLGRAGRARVQAVLPETKYVDLLDYPVSTLLPAVFLAASELDAMFGGFDAALKKLGEQAIDDFIGTAVGRTLVSVSAGEAKRLLRAAPGAFKTAVSYGSRELKFTSDTSCVLAMRRDFVPPPYHEGVLSAVLHALGHSEVLVRSRRLGLLDADYELSWQ